MNPTAWINFSSRNVLGFRSHISVLYVYERPTFECQWIILNALDNDAIRNTPKGKKSLIKIYKGGNKENIEHFLKRFAKNHWLIRGAAKKIILYYGCIISP